MKKASSTGQLLNMGSMDEDTGLVCASCTNANAATVREIDSYSL